MKECAQNWDWLYVTWVDLWLRISVYSQGRAGKAGKVNKDRRYTRGGEE